MNNRISYRLFLYFGISVTAVPVMGSDCTTTVSNNGSVLLPLLQDKHFSFVLNTLYGNVMKDNIAQFEAEPHYNEWVTHRYGPVMEAVDAACRYNNRSGIEKEIRRHGSQHIGHSIARFYDSLNTENKTFIASTVPYTLWHTSKNKFMEMKTDKTINKLETYLDDGFMIPFVACKKSGPIVPILHYFIAKIADAKNLNQPLLAGYFQRVKQLVQAGFNPRYEFNFISIGHVTPSDGPMPDPNLQEAFVICASKHNAYTWTQQVVTSEEHRSNLTDILNTGCIHNGVQKDAAHCNTVDMFLPGTQFCYLKTKFRDRLVYALHSDCDKHGHHIELLKGVTQNPKIGSGFIIDLIPHCVKPGSIKQLGTVPIEQLRAALQAIGEVRPDIYTQCEQLFKYLILEDNESDD